MMKSSFCIASKYDEVKTVSEQLMVFAEHHHIGASDIGGIELALAEATNNVIEHAYCEKQDGIIQVSLEMRDSDFICTLVDHGKGKTTEKATEPKAEQFPTLSSSDLSSKKLSTSIDDLPEGGFGLGIIQSVMDNVEYQSDADKNTLTLIKKIK